KENRQIAKRSRTEEEVAVPSQRNSALFASPSYFSFSSACQAVERPPRALEFHKALLFFAEFPRVRHQAAARAPRGMLHVQHLVKQNIFHRELRHAPPVHAAIEQNVVWPGIIAAKLPPPASIAPANIRALQRTVKISGV